MSADYRCPGCSGRLAISSLNGVRQYVCESCAGHVLTVVGLRHLSPDTANALWAHDEEANSNLSDAASVRPAEQGPARCPFCQREMRPKDFSIGHAAICRPCESIWLDKEAAQAVKVPEPATSSLPHQTRRCEDCGAVAEDTPDGNCRYCGSPLQLPTKVVVLEGPPAPGTGLGRGGSLLGGLASSILDNFLGWP